ncbi:MAG: type II toxin-antitoxin system CcdA family antitoxin [Azoarcus sp.]|jgi:antitoxin CcdA|nr:type II toxin-antitoxin system CcdA family antitoxin [Azoarcus sp.]
MPNLVSSRRTHSSGPSPRRATNLSLSADTLEAAKALNINISQTCDAHLRKVVKEEQARRWREEYANFIAAYNEILAAEDLPLDEWKTF